MSKLLITTLSLSCSGALLIIILFLFRPLSKKYLSKQWQYYIWLVVVARLFLPVTLEINLMETLFQRVETGIVKMETDLSFVRPTVSSPERNRPGNNIPKDRSPWYVSAAGEKSSLPNEWPKSLSSHILWLCWLVAALILFIRKVTIYQCFVRYIKAGCVEVSDINLLEQFGKLINRYRIKTTVEIYTNHLISSPLLLGFFRPCIVLPTDELSDSEFQYTVLHELTHYKRRDMFYKWLAQAAICVHWFNPLVYLMSREIERDCELSCDEAVIKNLDAQERLVYGETLLNAIGKGGGYKNSIASVTLGESGEQLKERLDAIKRFQGKSRFVISFTFILTIAICFGTAAMGAYAEDSLPDSKAASLMKPHTHENLTLVEKEYTVEELKRLDVSGIIIDTLSDHVSVDRGGNTLKFEYYAQKSEEYKFEYNPFNHNQDKVFILQRLDHSEVDDKRSITVTVPEQLGIKDLKITTTSGNISLTDCVAEVIEARAQNGQIDIYGGSVSERFSVQTKIGNIFVSGVSTPDSYENVSYCSTFDTESGTIIFQPINSADNYCFAICYGEEAEFMINNEWIESGYVVDSSGGETVENLGRLEPGPTREAFPEETAVGVIANYVKDKRFTINEDATVKINFNSLRGTMIVQEK